MRSVFFKSTPPATTAFLREECLGRREIPHRPRASLSSHRHARRPSGCGRRATLRRARRRRRRRDTWLAGWPMRTPTFRGDAWTRCPSRRRVAVAGERMRTRPRTGAWAGSTCSSAGRRRCVGNARRSCRASSTTTRSCGARSSRRAAAKKGSVRRISRRARRSARSSPGTRASTEEPRKRAFGNGRDEACRSTREATEGVRPPRRPRRGSPSRANRDHHS